jgi:hypothetical protein
MKMKCNQLQRNEEAESEIEIAESISCRRKRRPARKLAKIVAEEITKYLEENNGVEMAKI